MPDKDQDKTHLLKHDIQIPQNIIESFARFLVPEIRKFYESMEGQKAFEEWEKTQTANNEKPDKA